jgi:succinate-acetate transporter protein
MVKTSLADFPFHLHICQLIQCTLYNSFALEMSFQVHRIAIFFVFLLLFVLFFYFCIKELLTLPEHLSAPPGFSGFLLLNI